MPSSGAGRKRMADARVEYIGFEVNELTREYSLRAAMPDGNYQEFTIAIANEAFIDRRVRYQDAPDICFLKLTRALAADDDSLPAIHDDVTNAELEDYRLSHTPKPRMNRRKSAFK